MTLAFRKAGRPAFLRREPQPLWASSLAVLLISASALAGGATMRKPPEISYDNAIPATLQADPPSPVLVVELPRPLPLPGQLQPVEETAARPSTPIQRRA